jgi:hypothetical protein
MKSFANVLFWVAVIAVSADCPSVRAASLQGTSSQWESEQPAGCAMTECPRIRAGRSKTNFSVDDWLHSSLSFFGWLAGTAEQWISTCGAWVGCCFLALCLGSLRAEGPSGEVRYLPDGNGYIPVSDPFDYPRIPALDWDDPGSIFYTFRPNLFGVEVADEWDFYNLINTDRPDFTDATYSVGRGVTIIETGYTFRRSIDAESATRQSRRSLPEALVRCGITDEFEVRLKWNGYVMSDLHDLSSGLRQQIFGGDDMITSVKYEVWQQDGAIPMLTMLTGSTIPTGTNGISSNALQPFVNFVGGWGFRRWLYLKVSTGIDWQKTSISTLFGGGSEPTGPIVVFLRDNINVYHYSASLLYQALPRVGGFVELFGFGQTGGKDNRGSCFFDTGLFLYATTNVQFDVRFGERLSDRVDELFTGAGLSVRY